MKTKKIFQNSLKRGYILKGELRSIYENSNDISVDGILTAEEIQQMERLCEKTNPPDNQITLTSENKRSILKYLIDGELPKEREFKDTTNIDNLTEDEKELLFNILIKLEKAWRV